MSAAPGSGAPMRRPRLSFGGPRAWSASQLVLALLGSAGVATLLASLAQAAALSPFWWLLALVPLVGLAYSGTVLPLALGVAIVYVWTVHVPVASHTWWSVPAAAGLLVWHAATSLAAALPSSATIPRALAGRWAVRSGTVALAPVLAAAGVASAPVLGETPAVLAALVALLGVVALIWFTRSEPPAERE